MYRWIFTTGFLWVLLIEALVDPKAMVILFEGF